jgi:Metallo-peptidase family M12
MSNLPPQDSASYRALKRRAGKVCVEVLTLTKAEMWSVPIERAEAVKYAAQVYGAVASELASDWNHIFRPMPSHGSKNQEHKAMLPPVDGGMIATVGQIFPARAAMIEYALTRKANAGPPGSEPAKVVLNLNEGTRLSVNRISLDVKPDMMIWRGTVDGTNGDATLMWWPGVAMTGTVRHEGRIFSIRRMRGGVQAIAVVETSEARLPPEHAPAPANLRTNDANLQDDPLARRGDASELRAAGSRREPSPVYTAPASDAAGPSSEVIINVIVAYTRRAAGKYSDVERELVALSIEEANQSFQNSKLGHIRLKLVHAYQTDYVEDGLHFDHVWRFADKNDGYMDEIHGLREKYDADVAILIVDDPSGCGLSTRVYADPDEAFAVVHHECAVMSYSVAHEIGHLIGARHEFAVDKQMTPFPYGHGYVNGTKWRDIMSYKESCGGCPRVPVWSSPQVMVSGERAGTAMEDNARVLAEQAGRVANFRASRSKLFLSAGPRSTAPQAGIGDQPR